LSETLSLKTNDATAPVVLVSIAGTVQAPVTVSPASVSFGSVKVGQMFEQKVMVRAAKPFTVQPLAETADGLALDTFPIAGPVQIVTVKFTPKAAGKFAKTLTLQTDLGPATVTVEGEAAP
jgi:hypothetical protein